MKHINIKNIIKIPYNPEALVQYYLMDGKKRQESSTALESMDNPSNIDEAIKFLEKMINDDSKFDIFLELKDNDKKEIFSKIIYTALLNNRYINKELELFHRKALSSSTEHKVNAWFVILNYANKVYKKETPANNLSYKWGLSDTSIAS